MAIFEPSRSALKYYRSEMRSVVTRFRAYQLGSPGSSFSYFADGHFTLLEARLTKLSQISLKWEMEECGVEAVDTLHITSWDEDHCCSSEIEELLEFTRPTNIECPGYDTHTTNGESCKGIIEDYRIKSRKSNRKSEVCFVSPEYISALQDAEHLGFKNIFYHPKIIDENCANNNSTIKMFRKGSFNVLSLGDVESKSLSDQLSIFKILQQETDVMILAHHGADNGFTSKRLLKNLSPSLAVCSSDYSNQYDHPRPEIRKLLYDFDINIFTTKTGDVTIRSIGNHQGRYRVTNWQSNSTRISSQYEFVSKKAKLLSYNSDTIREIYSSSPHHPKR